jgi:5-methylcytosine-specific restriction protein A
MKAYLLTYNPLKWTWDNIDSEVIAVQKNEYIPTKWDCFSRQPKEGDIFFIVALGKSSRKGIFCSGIINELELGMPSLINGKTKTNRISGDINFLLNPEKSNIIDLNFLKKEFPDQRWDSQKSGISIKDKYVDMLLQNWNKIINKSNIYLNKNSKNIILKKEYWEGNPQQNLSTTSERNIRARNDCIKINGYICKVCGQKMENIYGEIGKNFIHVHHIVFHSSKKGNHKIDPKNDLITVCPNCHSMLHKKLNGEYLSIEELKKIIKKQT